MGITAMKLITININLSNQIGSMRLCERLLDLDGNTTLTILLIKEYLLYKRLYIKPDLFPVIFLFFFWNDVSSNVVNKKIILKLKH